MIARLTGTPGSEAGAHTMLNTSDALAAAATIGRQVRVPAKEATEPNQNAMPVASHSRLTPRIVASSKSWAPTCDPPDGKGSAHHGQTNPST
ncbi:MAG: hypothetical protein K0S86_524 [Geminicoccaceae bacterium]|nr:hypothetical protein [Geminicoccaceae bacterium]